MHEEYTLDWSWSEVFLVIVIVIFMRPSKLLLP